jgi:outer membrane biosynthesis protein TonB
VHFFAVLTASLICLHATAQAAEKSSPTAAYNERLAEIAKQALNAELLKHPERLNDVSMKLHYMVDRNGRVHNVEVVSRTPDRWAEKTAARVLAGTKFPPIPIDVQLEVRAGYIEAEARLSYGAEAPSASNKENSASYRYNMRVHKMLQDDVILAFHAPHHLEVDYEFYLDRQGHITSMKVHAKAGGQWAEQIIARSIRRLKFPPAPPQVFKELEQKPPLRIFGTMTWDPQ